MILVNLHSFKGQERLFLLKNKKGISITNAFQEFLNEYNCRRNKILAEKGSEFCNRSMKSWLQDNDIEKYSTHNEGKSVATERFIRIFRNKIDKQMFSVFKNVYIEKLDNLVNEYKNTYHRTVKMKPADVKSNIYFDFTRENNKEDSKFGEHVGISKCKNIFAKGYTPS